MIRRYCAILLFLIPVLSSKGQMITTDPAIPVTGRVIKIFFNSADPSVTELKNSTGDLYAHTGVTIGGIKWQKVIGAWGENSTQPKLRYQGNYLYELDIAPDIKTFYGLSPADVATQICLVIRNSDGSRQTRPDIFIDVTEPKLNVTFILPGKPFLITDLTRQIALKAAATLDDSVSLYVNNVFIRSGQTPELLTDTIFFSQYGEFWIKAVAWDKPISASDSFLIYVRKPVVTEALPDGLDDGINYSGNSSVTLVLHAPYKKYVFTTGDFTGWLPSDMGYMKRTPDSARYWVEINNLIPGKEYRFQYLVDSSLFIADPYADKILDPDNDKFIAAETYPGLIKYPSDTTTGIVSVFQTSRPPYLWQTKNFNPPEKSRLVIYELLVRDFTAKHDFKTLIDTLGYLDNLGVNAIELMPVCEFEGNISWGYNPSFYFAPDKYYGPENDLKAFVDSCHSRGIAVIMDMVLDHCAGQSPFVQLYLDHFGSDQIYMKIPNPWFNASSPNPVYKFGADFNHESPWTQKLVDRITSYWLTEYRVDGFRFDFTKGFTNIPGEGSDYDATRIAILKRMADKIWEVNPFAYVILEHFTADPEEKELAGYGMMPWGNMNYNYAEAAMGFDSDLTAVSAKGRGWSVPNMVSYMESHDEERLMYKTITYSSVTNDYNTRLPKVALQRMALDAAFYFTVPGPKMIWQFGELGYDISINENGRTGEKPLRWYYYSDPDRHRLFLMYKLLINLRKTQPVFGTDDYTYSLAGTAKRFQLNSSDIKVNILGNFGVIPTSVFPAFQQPGKWYEYFSGDSVNITNTTDPIIFKAGEYRLYTTKKLPSSTLILGVEDKDLQQKSGTITVYPNPSDGEFNFKINPLTTKPVTLSIFDLTGRMIRQYKSEISDKGIITWDGRDDTGSTIADGLYIVNIRSGPYLWTAKIIKQ